MLTDLPEGVLPYFQEQGVDVSQVHPADVVLALLRMGRLNEAQELAGVRITRCPDYIPLWPPKPVERKASGPTVAAIIPNPCIPTSDMHRRYALVRVGMSRQELRDKGISSRDLVEWERRGMIQWDTQKHSPR